MKKENNIEIEYKYLANITKKEFHSYLQNMNEVSIISEPIYICSCDDYYKGMNPNSFIRYRKGSSNTELTLKAKKNGNMIRKEVNLNITGNNDSSIVEFLELSGYNKEFSIFKEAWIWKVNYLNNIMDISYYTLPDKRSFIEVEVEHGDFNEEAGIQILNSFVSSILNVEKLGLVRENRSLFEIFMDEKNNDGQLDLFKASKLTINDDGSFNLSMDNIWKL